MRYCLLFKWVAYTAYCYAMLCNTLSIFGHCSKRSGRGQMDSWQQVRTKESWSKQSLRRDGRTSQCRMAMRRRLKSPPHSDSRASFRVTSYFSRYMSFTVCRSSCWSGGGGGKETLALIHKSSATAWSVWLLKPCFFPPAPPATLWPRLLALC